MIDFNMTARRRLLPPTSKSFQNQTPCKDRPNKALQNLLLTLVGAQVDKGAFLNFRVNDHDCKYEVLATKVENWYSVYTGPRLKSGLH